MANRGLYEIHRTLVRDVKLHSGCADCGYKAHHAALQFDHLPGTTKRGTIGQLCGKSDVAVLDEMDKCDIVCANCHAIRTFIRGQLVLRLSNNLQYNRKMRKRRCRKI